MAPPLAAADNPAVVRPVETVTETPPSPPSQWQPTVLAGLGARGNAVIGQPRQWYGVSLRAPALTKYSLVVDGGAASVRNSHSNPGPCETCEPTITYSTDTMPILRLGAGYTDGTMDAVVGLSKIGADVDGFARFTAYWGQRFVRIGIRDGSEVVVPQEFARVAVGSFLDAGEFPLDLSLALTVMRNGSALDPNFDLGVGGTWHGLRVVGHVSTNVITFALGYTPVVPPRFSPPLEPPPGPPKSALNEPDPATIVPAFNALAVTGRELTFVTKGLSAALSRCLLVQRRDFYPEGRQVALLRFTCTDGLPEADTLPYDGPLLVRSGCYTLDASGLWRMPACPDSAGKVSGQRRVLVVPSTTSGRGPNSRFYDMTAKYLSRRTVVVDGKPVVAHCASHFLAGMDEVCAAEDYGLLWARTTSGLAISLAAIATAEVAFEHSNRFLALTGADLACSLSSPCAAIGHCHHVDGRCVALGNGDCAAASCCPSVGACTSENGTCVATSDAGCAASETCRIRGRCAAVSGRCRVMNADHCQASTGCRDHGKCSPLLGECAVGSNQDCQQHVGCFDEGLCARRGTGCIAVADAYCAKSIACASEERCRAAEGRCVK